MVSSLGLRPATVSLTFSVLLFLLRLIFNLLGGGDQVMGNQLIPVLPWNFFKVEGISRGLYGKKSQLWLVKWGSSIGCVCQIVAFHSDKNNKKYSWCAELELLQTHPWDCSCTWEHSARMRAFYYVLKHTKIQNWNIYIKKTIKMCRICHLHTANAVGSLGKVGPKVQLSRGANNRTTLAQNVVEWA